MAEWTVKFLIGGDPPPAAAIKGDVISMVPAACDWGSATVIPAWVRLSVTEVVADTQQAADEKGQGWITSGRKGFRYSYIDGAAEGWQRYKVEAVPSLAANMGPETKAAMRDAIVAETGGVVVDQGSNFADFDIAVPPLWGLDEIAQIVDDIGFRRYCVPDSMIDTAIASTAPGDPAEYTRTQTQMDSILIDKMHR